jgi:adenine-specific DNA-methyltransferase
MERTTMLKPTDHFIDLDGLELLDRESLIDVVKRMVNGGVSLSFHGKRTAMEIARKVRPRVTRRIKDLHIGTPEDQSKNLLIEGENLQAMVTLYKYHGQIDLIVTDPPYNTGQYFRYNDRWDEDPNDPELGTVITLEDGSRHTKWMKTILPRLQMMKAMLRPQGVIAMCIDDNELFHLGLMMDEVFGEENRIAIINWQKAYSPKNDSRHISTATEYVLVYAKDRLFAKTGLTPRTEEMNAAFRNPDNDPRGSWASGDPTARTRTERDRYGIQSPFTGAILYPGYSSWRFPKARIKAVLEEWGMKYVEKNINDGRTKALVIANAPIPNLLSVISNLDESPVVVDEDVYKNPVIEKTRSIAEDIRDTKVWPILYFNSNGSGRLRMKRSLSDVKKGKVVLSYWADEDYSSPLEIGPQSWDHEESGHSQSGINELNTMVGKGHGFDTVKPLKLIKKIIQIWCSAGGVVMDPYAGSGTTGHAVLELNKESGADRRFILIEQGRPDNGDKYARTLTWQRLKNAITGDRPTSNGMEPLAEPLGGGFEFRMLTSQIDAKTVLSMKKDELVDVVITSHWDSGSRNSPNLIRIEDQKFKYLVGKNQQNEGYFIIWNNGGPVGQLDISSYNLVLQDAKKAGLKPPYNIYARYEVYQSKNVHFYKIPDKILAHLGLNESSDPYNEEGGDI